jgi:hypothetical protein
MTPEELAATLRAFLAEAPHAVVLEDGVAVFDFHDARYTVSTERGKCVLHLWSEERNTVRRVLAAEEKSGVLRLSVQRFGQTKPSKLEICRERDRRSPTAKEAARAAYQRLLGRVLEREFADWKASPLTSAMDLERSFGPIYARGMLRRGRSAFAVLGVNDQETQASIDAAVTFGILWLAVCREREAARSVVVGLKLFVPAGTSAIVRERMAHLDHSAAKFELYELHEKSLALTSIDTSDRGNIATRLVQAPDEQMLHARFADCVALLRGMLPNVEVVTVSPTELSFRQYGLQVARAELLPVGNLTPEARLFFGTGPGETVDTDKAGVEFGQFIRKVASERHLGGDRNHPLFRMVPERWLESLVVRDVEAIDARLDPAHVYSQVPAFAAGDRAMIDVLCATKEGRLAVIELKAEEDIHLPLQGLDYWSRVNWHHQRGEFKRFGYFPGCALAAEPPLLFLVAPALRVHPATDTLLKYLAPELDVTLVGIDERWREGVRVVFRKRREQPRLAAQGGNA